MLQPVVDVLFHQGADGGATVRTPTPWRPLAAGVVVLLGGVAATVLGVIGTELVNVLLAAGITLVAAGLVDGTGRRFRGAGTGLVIVAVSAKLIDSVTALSQGWPYGVFLVLWGSWVILRNVRSAQGGS